MAEVYRGSSSNAGELRHISLDVDGEECFCGNRGCLELFTAIERAARYLALGTVTLVNLSDLELVVLAGHGFAHAGERYVSAVRRELASRSFAGTNHDLEVRLSPITTTSAPSARPRSCCTPSSHRRRSTSAPGPVITPGG